MSFLSLIFRLQGDNSDFKSKVRDSQHSVEGLAGKLHSIGAGIKMGLEAFGAEKLVEGFHQLAEYGAHLKDIEERLDLGAEATQRYANSARRSGTDIDTVAASFDKMRKNLGTSLGTGKEAEKMRDHFEELGISLDDIKSKQPEQIFDAMLDKMASGQMTLEQFTAGTETLGKGFAKLIPFAIDFGHHHGDLLFSQAEIDTLKQANDKYGDLKTNLMVAGAKVMTKIQEFGGLVGGILHGNPMAYADGEWQERKDREEEEERKRELKKKAEELAEQQRKKDEDEATARKANSATMERVEHLDKSTDDINEKNRKKALTDEERLNELIAKRVKLKEHLDYFDKFNDQREANPETAEADARVRKELAETNQEIQQESEKHRQTYEKPDVDAGARVGLFIGGRRDPLVDINTQHLNVSREIKAVLDDIKNQKPKEIFS